MCIPGIDPATLLLSAAVSGAGGLVNAGIQNDYINEQNRQNRIAMEGERSARLAESERQRAMEDDQMAILSRALTEDVDPALLAKSVEEEVADPTNAIVTAADEYNVPMLQGQDENSPVAGRIGKIVADALETTKGILKAQSTLSEQGVALSGSQDALTRAAGDIGNIGTDRQGSLNVSRMETFVPPAQVTPSDSILGDILMLGGQAIPGFGTGGKVFGAKPKPGFNLGYGSGITPLSLGTGLI